MTSVTRSIHIFCTFHRTWRGTIGSEEKCRIYFYYYMSYNNSTETKKVNEMKVFVIRYKNVTIDQIECKTMAQAMRHAVKVYGRDPVKRPYLSVVGC